MWKKVFSLLLVPGLILGAEETVTVDNSAYYVAITPGCAVGELGVLRVCPSLALDGGYRMRSKQWGVDTSVGLSIAFLRVGAQGMFYPCFRGYDQIYIGIGVKGCFDPTRRYEKCLLIDPFLSVGKEMRSATHGKLSFLQVSIQPNFIDPLLCFSKNQCPHIQLSYGFSF